MTWKKKQEFKKHLANYETDRLLAKVITLTARISCLKTFINSIGDAKLSDLIKIIEEQQPNIKKARANMPEGLMVAKIRRGGWLSGFNTLYSVTRTYKNEDALVIAIQKIIRNHEKTINEIIRAEF